MTAKELVELLEAVKDGRISVAEAAIDIDRGWRSELEELKDKWRSELEELKDKHERRGEVSPVSRARREWEQGPG